MDAVRFLRPVQLLGTEIEFPTTDVRGTLGLRQEARQAALVRHFAGHAVHHSVLRGARTPLQPNVLAVLAQVAVLEGHRRPDTAKPADLIRGTQHVIRVHVLREGPRQQLLLGVPQDPAKGRVNQLEVAIHPRYAEHVHGQLKKQRKTLRQGHARSGVRFRSFSVGSGNAWLGVGRHGMQLARGDPNNPSGLRNQPTLRSPPREPCTSRDSIPCRPLLLLRRTSCPPPCFKAIALNGFTLLETQQSNRPKPNAWT